MKKLVVTFLTPLLMVFAVSCATTAIETPGPDPYTHITVENVKKDCQAEESWQVNPFGLPGLVLMFKDCLGIPRLVVITVQAKNGDDEIYTEEIRKESAKLLALHYTHFMDRRGDHKESIVSKGDPAGVKWSLKKIKEEFNDGWETHFYTLSFRKTSIKCNGSTCPRQSH